jgi:hypothetical protein
MLTKISFQYFKNMKYFSYSTPINIPAIVIRRIVVPEISHELIICGAL